MLNMKKKKFIQIKFVFNSNDFIHKFYFYYYKKDQDKNMFFLEYIIFVFDIKNARINIS